MIKPPTPVDELLRLETLRKLNILDTDPEERFDRVTRLAKRLFGMPIALVSLLDADRQWFKSRQGLEVSETTKDISFCGHAILDDEILVVNDACEDERFSDNPLVAAEPNIRFYAGYPLNGPDGSKVGTLCVIDRVPREMTPDDLTLLQDLGRMVEEELVVANMMRSDPITGLSNRIGFSMIAEHLLAMCARTKLPASLILFHQTNQDLIDVSLGSAESDRAAIELTQQLMATFRDSDIVGRLAIDTFAVLLAGSPLDDIDRILQRLNERLEQRNRQSDCAYELEVESYAVAYDPDRHPDVESFIEDAENGMVDVDASESAGDETAAQRVRSA